MFFMLVIMTINTEQLPVAAIDRIIFVVVVAVMNRQLLEPLAGKFATATPAQMRKQLECPSAITLLPFSQIAVHPL